MAGRSVLRRLRRAAGRVKRRLRRRRIYYDVIPAQVDNYVPDDHARQITSTYYIDVLADLEVDLSMVRQ